ncbi:MAG: hypothetical protein FJX57_03065 [Alphaproteobacteria bacterium]|nr:hypothetical protein [Alphaproteobacteria bacterium]
MDGAVRADHAAAMIDLSDDDQLGYRRARTALPTGARLVLDEAYRHAHLPLVAPRHPRVVAARPGSDTVHGRHARTYSLVLMIDGQALRRSAEYRALEAALLAAPFANKIAWDVLARRWDRLHATLCGGLGADGAALLASMRAALRELGPFAVELRGLFSGTINLGRLYLRAYPQRRGDGNAVQALQRRLGRRETDLYLVGMFNLVDDLDVRETAALDALLTAWWERPLLRFEASELTLLGATDDLVLDAPERFEIPLTPGATTAT